MGLVAILVDACYMSDELLSRAQFEAARMLVARLHAEAQNVDFDVSDLGWTWLTPDDQICAVSEEGVELRQGDVVYAAVVLLWSMAVGAAMSQTVTVDRVIERLGLGVASHEPASTGRN